MRRNGYILALLVISMCLSFSFSRKDSTSYISQYRDGLNRLTKSFLDLEAFISESNLESGESVENILSRINHTRTVLKAYDFWLRYMEPITYRQLNGPLPVEWETEVFEKYEKPYRREGAGLTLATLYLEEEKTDKDFLLRLIRASINAGNVYLADSVADHLRSHHHFFLCNRLFLLNLAAIYTTGFECPDTSRVIPELQSMLAGVNSIYQSFNKDFSQYALSEDYLKLYSKTIGFVSLQPANYSQFDHFTFIKEYVNPLFALNQEYIRKYGVSSRSYADYSLNNNCVSIFRKNLFSGQNLRGIFSRVKDPSVMAEIGKTGKQLFFDPILSGNNKRSCASCHKPDEYFTETLKPFSAQFDKEGFLARNTLSLLNARYNHLLMTDGKHISLQNQGKDVVASPHEMGGDPQEILKKILSCGEYKKAFQKFLKHTPQEKEITMDHIVSAVTVYYGAFSNFYSPFDDAMHGRQVIDASTKNGFNLFMSKAQCATCHFVPQFNGVKPPYTGSEFEVLGVPADTIFSRLSADEGRYKIHPAPETLHAYRTSTVRNTANTPPYMHNGVFNSLEKVIDFYDSGGGAGRGLNVSNQTLASDSLRLSAGEKNDILAFIKSLNENIPPEHPPVNLPSSKIKELNSRKPGGEY